MREKRQRKIVIPNRLVDHALNLYTDGSLNLVSRRNRQGHCVHLDIPYDLGDIRFQGFRLIKQGRTVTAKLVGLRTLACTLTKAQQDKIRRLFSTIDSARKNKRFNEFPCQVIGT